MIRPNGRVTGAVVHGDMNEWDQLVSSAESGIKKFAITAIFVTADCNGQLYPLWLIANRTWKSATQRKLNQGSKAGYKNLKLQQKN